MSSDVRRLSRGVSMRTGYDGIQALRAELVAWTPLLPPSGVFTGLTVLRAFGLWMPLLPVELPVFVAMGTVAGEYKPERAQLVVSRHPTPPARVTVAGVGREGLVRVPVAPIADALLAASRCLGLLDLVVLVDSALHAGLVTVPELEEVAGHRRRGVRQLRRALELADGRSESAWETMLRVLHVVAGVDVEPQVEIMHPDGGLAGRVDLLVVGSPMAQEYDGGEHRKKARHRRDLKREQRLADAEVVRRGWVAADLLFRPDDVLAPVARFLGRRLSSEPWRLLLRDSLWTQAGRDRFAARLGRELTWPSPAYE